MSGIIPFKYLGIIESGRAYWRVYPVLATIHE
jgi:hypothetical protein